MRRIKEKITKLKNRRKPNKNYSKTSRLSREAARKKQGEREIQRMKIEDLEDLAEKGEKMEFLILEETAILTFIDQKSKEERKEWSKLKEIKFLVWEATKTVTDLNNQAPKEEEGENMRKNNEGVIVILENPPEMVIKKGGPHGEDVILPLKHINGVPVYIKEVELPTDELFGWESKKNSPTLLPMAENKKRLNTLKGFFLTIWKLFRMIPI